MGVAKRVGNSHKGRVINQECLAQLVAAGETGQCVAS